VRGRLIANPTSGTDRAPALLTEINERLRSIVTDLDITITLFEEDALRAARRAAESGCELVFVAGGDGTLNAAVRGVAAVDGALDRIVFGVIPAGTGNDFARTLDLGELAGPALDRLVERRMIDVDLGTLNDRVFVNISAGGFIADVSAVTSEPLKDALGRLAYVIGGARALVGREPFSARVRLAAGDSLPAAAPFGRTTALQMFAVCNARFIGGGRPIAPDALIDDGLLDVLLVKPTPTLEFVGLLQKIAAGQHGGDERVVQFRSGVFELLFDRMVHVNIDGEVLEAESCRYAVRRRAARFLCGPQPHAAAAPRPLMV
jgi:diacylglycerol kinase (ATP)